MQIVIFKSSKNKSSSYKINGYIFISFILLLIIIATLTLSSTSFLYGYKKGYKELNEDRIEDISTYERKIEAIKIKNKEKMEFFSKKLITISSELENINSLGNKISSIAKLDKNEFNFKNPKYIGGINKVNIDFDYNSKFDEYLDSILVDLKNKYQNLQQIDKIINNLEMKEQFSPTGMPTKKGYVSSRYGQRINPITKKSHIHKGIDIANKTETDIFSLAAGKVTFSGKKYGYGNLVEISHLNGYVTRYAHNNRNLVKVGDLVKKGQLIAKMGSTGHSTGPHVHLEILKNNKHINPNKFIYTKEKFSNKD